jgi:hypothetical protein
LFGSAGLWSEMKGKEKMKRERLSFLLN